MWKDRRILDLLQIEHPILQAPMAGASGPELVSAVSEAGALGGLGAAGTPPDRLREVIGSVRELTDRAIHVNLFEPETENFDHNARPSPHLRRRLEQYHQELDLGAVPDPRPLFGPAREQLEVLLELEVPVISFHFGVQASMVELVHAAGFKVLSTATTVAEAKILEDRGVDAVIAQGAEAGGHQGTFDSEEGAPLVGTLALVPRVVDAVSIPVVAAGGIMDARGLVACLALGASAVQMGTAFLGCREAPISDTWRAALRTAEAEDTKVTSSWSGKPARAIRNRFVDEIDSLGEKLLPYPAQYSISGLIRGAAGRRGDPDFLTMWAGQGVGLFRDLPAALLVAELVAETQTVLSSIHGRE